MTYRALDRAANGLAALLAARGVGPEDVVGVALSRSLALPVALLGIWKAGAAYLPLDPAYPAERIALMAEQVLPVAVVTESTVREQMPTLEGTPVICLDRDSLQAAGRGAHETPASQQPSQAAYVIHTSGSTGRPKGVVVTHAGLASLATAQGARLGVTSDSRVLQFASVSFDASVSEMLMALTTGAALVLLTESERAGRLLLERLTQFQITHATLPPTVLGTLPRTDARTLAWLVVAGEACAPELAARWASGRQLVNAYGPTEATVCATMSGPLGGGVPLSIGSPLPNARVTLLDAALRTVPPVALGEIYIGGVGLARGYAGQPSLTAERFVADPNGPPGTRLYRTGDLARWRSDGTLDFVARADRQVKIRGARVEPGEVEAALRAQPSCQDAVVVSRGSAGEQRLVAYVTRRVETSRSTSTVESLPDTPSGGDLVRDVDAVDGRRDARPSDSEVCHELRRSLSRQLPDHFVPAAIVLLERVAADAERQSGSGATAGVRAPGSARQRSGAADAHAGGALRAFRRGAGG